MTWADVTIVIPTVLSFPGRAASLISQLERVARECQGAAVRVIPQWYSEHDSKAALTAMANGLHDVGRQRVLWIEDDVEFCEDFGARAIDEIDATVGPNRVLSLFSQLRLPPGIRPIKLIMGCQAVAMPAWIAHEWSAELVRLRDSDPPPHGSYAAIDLALTDLCRAHGVEVLGHFPSLVQHGALDSVWGHQNTMHSPTFAG